MKLLFLDPPGYQHQGYNLGLAMLCGALAGEGHQTLIFDRNEGGDMEQVIAAFSPQVIGVSIKTATYSAGIRVAEQAAAIQPDALMVAGGPHPTIEPEDVLNGTRAVNVALSGEAEAAIVQLTRSLDQLGQRELQQQCSISRGGVEPLELLEALSGVGGIAYRGGSGQIIKNPVEVINDLDSLAFPRLESFINVDAGSRPYHLMTSRGCPFRCAYCSVRSIAGRRLRTRSVEHVVEELLFARSCYGVDGFEIDDDNFTLKLERAKMFCEVLIQRRVDLPWYLPNGIRAEMLDSELAYLLAKANCHTVALGIESADPGVLRAIHKGMSPEVVRRAVKLLHHEGIRVMGFFIVGLPSSDLESDLRTINFERNLDLDDRIYNAYVPYPCTEGYEWAEKHGRFLADYRDALHFSDREETVFETDKYPAAQRRAALTLARLGTTRLAETDYQLLSELVLTGLDQDTLVVEVESYCPNIHEVLRLFTPLTVLHIRDRSGSQEIVCEEPDGHVSFRAPLAEGWQHDLSLAGGIARALAGRRFQLTVVPQIHSYLMLSLAARSKHRFQYTFTRQLSSTSPRQILLDSPLTFFRSRARGGLQQAVPDPMEGVELGYRLWTDTQQLGRRLGQWGDRARRLPAWFGEVPLSAGFALVSELSIHAQRLRRAIGKKGKR